MAEFAPMAMAVRLKLPRFSMVVADRGDAYVANRIRTSVASACHDVLAFAVAAFGKLAALAPDRAPLVERQKERNIAQLGVMLMRCVGVHFRIGIAPRLDFIPDFVRVGSVSCARSGSASFSVVLRPLCRAGDGFLAVRVIPRAFRGQLPFSAIIRFSHWFLAHRTVVRGGIGASTLVLSRFYHGERGEIQS